MTASVVYRIEPLTVADYDEAILNLTAARDQIIKDELWHGCGYCGSEEHQPNTCHHNPLVRAREAVQKINREHWRCFHCGYVFDATEGAAAREHFGITLDSWPKCVAERLTAAGIRWTLTPGEDGAMALSLDLMPEAAGEGGVA